MNTQNRISMKDKLKLKVKVNGEGLPLLLVPGGLTGWKSWESFVETFTSMKRNVIRVQLLNVEYGIKNKQLPAEYSVKTESQALAAILDSLGSIYPIDVLAWSYGALISLDYALDHPGKIRSLTLIEPPAIWILRSSGTLDVQTQLTLDFLESLHGDITENMLERFLKEVGFVKPGQSPRELPQWKQWLPFSQSLRNSPAVATHNDDLKRLQSIKAPVLLVKGTGSALFLHKIIDLLASEFPNSKVLEMPGGHAPHIVSRDRFLNELQIFQKETSHQPVNIRIPPAFSPSSWIK